MLTEECVMRKVLVLVMVLLVAGLAYGQDAGVRWPISGIVAADTVFTFPADQARTLNFNYLPDFEATLSSTGTDTIGVYRRIDGFANGGDVKANFTYDANVGWVVTVTYIGTAKFTISAWK